MAYEEIVQKNILEIKNNGSFLFETVCFGFILGKSLIGTYSYNKYFAH
jgi:hypothetical protein